MNQDSINLLQKYFRNKPVKKAYLFGSFSRNTENENSDIDLLLELDYIKHIGFQFIDMHDEIQSLLNRKVDIVTQNSLSKYLRPIVDKEKKLIYEKQ